MPYIPVFYETNTKSFYEIITEYHRKLVSLYEEVSALYEAIAEILDTLNSMSYSTYDYSALDQYINELMQSLITSDTILDLNRAGVESNTGSGYTNNRISLTSQQPDATIPPSSASTRFICWCAFALSDETFRGVYIRFFNGGTYIGHLPSIADYRFYTTAILGGTNLNNVDATTYPTGLSVEVDTGSSDTRMTKLKIWLQPLINLS